MSAGVRLLAQGQRARRLRERRAGRLATIFVRGVILLASWLLLNLAVAFLHAHSL